MGIPFAAPPGVKWKKRRVVQAGQHVTYHDVDGNRRLAVVRFDALGRADLMEQNHAILCGVREGTEVGMWSR